MKEKAKTNTAKTKTISTTDHPTPKRYCSLLLDCVLLIDPFRVQCRHCALIINDKPNHNHNHNHNHNINYSDSSCHVCLFVHQYFNNNSSSPLPAPDSRHPIPSVDLFYTCSMVFAFCLLSLL